MESISKLNILIIDDDGTTVDKIKEDLRSLGFSGELFDSADGKEGLEKLKSLAFDSKIGLIICDIVMPIRTGVEFLQDLRASDSAISSTPCLMLTSKSDRQMVVSCIKFGASQYLIKPWTSKDLLLKIQEALQTS